MQINIYTTAFLAICLFSFLAYSHHPNGNWKVGLFLSLMTMISYLVWLAV